MLDPHQYETARLTFRAAEPSDYAPTGFLSSLLASESVQLGLTGSVVQPYSSKKNVSFFEYHNKGNLHLVIQLKAAERGNGQDGREITAAAGDDSSSAEPRPIGWMCLSSGHAAHRSAHFGLAIAPQFQGQGYAREAMTYLLERAFNGFGLHRVEGDVFSWNVAARRCYESLGFVVEGTRRDTVWAQGAFRDDHAIGILASEWKPEQRISTTTTSNALRRQSVEAVESPFVDTVAPPSFTTDRLVFRAVEPSDNQGLFRQLFSSPKVIQGITSTVEQPFSQTMVDEWHAQCDKAALQAVFSLKSESTKDAESKETPVGWVVLDAVQGQHRKATFGLAILPQFQGERYGAEALDWLLERAFVGYGLHKVEGLVWAWNEPARRTYRSVGFVEEGRKREAVWQNGQFRDQILLGLLASDWYHKKQKGAEPN